MSALPEKFAQRYALKKLLGEGGMGQVYQAWDESLSRDVAIKVLLSEVASRADGEKRFEREARVSASFHHPGAVQIYDFGRQDGFPYLVMELLGGHSLRAHLASQDNCSDNYGDNTLFFSVAKQLAEVMSAAHAAGLVHRDLKPDNIQVESLGNDVRVRVLDFGMAFCLDGDPETGRLTREGLAGGTPHYMAPEQVLGTEALGSPVDTYAMGVVFFEMLTARRPFEGAPPAVLSSHLYEAPPRISEHAQGVRPALAELVESLLRKDAAQRPSAQQFLDRLTDLGDASRPDTTQAPAWAPRAARMVSLPTMRFAPLVSAQAQICHVALLGPAEQKLGLGLASNGIAVIECNTEQELVEQSAQATCVYAAGVSLEGLACLVASETPVIAAVDSGDMDGIRDLLRLGVAEVVTRPVEPDRLARVVHRAQRRSANKRSSSNSIHQK